MPQTIQKTPETVDAFDVLTTDQILDAMSKDARSLLLYLETRAVDQCGIVDTAHMNAADLAIAKDWAARGFIRFSRLLARHLKSSVCPSRRNASHCVMLMGQAWTCAAAERRRRAARSLSPVVKKSLEHHENP